MKDKAAESKHIKSARKKLERQMSQENKKLTPTAREQMTRKIHQWIARHAEERVDLKDKSIELFDENKHSAQISNHFVKNLQKVLKQQSEQESESLKGRITSKVGESKE